MANQTRIVTVKQVPAKLGMRQRWLFLREIEDCMNGDRPRPVLDCTNVLGADRLFIHLLLRCLEEAMKRNGDVKLAAIPHGTKATLERIGASRLFEIFDTTDAAVDSFLSNATMRSSQPSLPTPSSSGSEQAA